MRSGYEMVHETARVGSASPSSGPTSVSAVGREETSPINNHTPVPEQTAQLSITPGYPPTLPLSKDSGHLYLLSQNNLVLTFPGMSGAKLQVLCTFWQVA